MSHTQTVAAIYEAFGRGDVPAILDRLADDVAWEARPDGQGAHLREAPWLAERHGRAEVAGFFESLQQLEFHEFRPTALLADADLVAAVIAVDIAVRATGRRFRDLEVHLWTFGADGKATEFRHVLDTAKHVEAAAPQPVA